MAETDQRNAPENATPKPFIFSEDWLAVILAFVLILLSAVGVLGPNGLNIRF